MCYVWLYTVDCCFGIMFELVNLRDTVTIHPKDFDSTFEKCASRALNTKLANKVTYYYYYYY